MRNRDERLANAHFISTPGGAAVKLQSRRSSATDDLDILPHDAARLSRPERFHRGFLDGETACEMWDRVSTLCTIGNLAVGKDAAQESISISFEHVGDSRQVRRIDTYSNDGHV